MGAGHGGGVGDLAVGGQTGSGWEAFGEAGGGVVELLLGVGPGAALLVGGADHVMGRGGGGWRRRAVGAGGESQNG